MARRVFIPHHIGPHYFVSERRTDERGTVSFAVVLRLARDGVTIANKIDPFLTDKELTLCRNAVQLMRECYSVYRETSPFDPIALGRTGRIHSSPAMLVMIKMWAEYNSAVLVYAALADDYLSRDPDTRFDVEFSLDLYRKALGFYDLERAKAMMEEDGPKLAKLPLSAHHRECIYDAFFHICTRLGPTHRRAGYEHLTKAWQANGAVSRSRVLINEAAYYRESDAVVRHAEFIETEEDLTPGNLAQLVVAYRRLDQHDKAREMYDRLTADVSDKAMKMVERLSSFMNEEPR